MIEKIYKFQLLILILLIYYVPTSNAGLFGPNNYEECIEDVIKSARTESATELGKDNCLNKYIQPEFDKRYKKAEDNRYRNATESEIALLKCERAKIFSIYVSCAIPGQMSKIYKLKMTAELKDGSIVEVELKNSVIRNSSFDTYSWSDNAYAITSAEKIKKFRKETLQIKPSF